MNKEILLEEHFLSVCMDNLTFSRSIEKDNDRPSDIWHKVYSTDYPNII